MLDSVEKIFLSNLLNKVKYSELNLYELNQFANSPIINGILEKIKNPKLTENSEKFHSQNHNIKRFCFKLDNHVGNAVKNRLSKMDDSTFLTIKGWNENETKEFALDIIGPIEVEEIEIDKLVKYLFKLADEKTSR